MSLYEAPVSSSETAKPKETLRAMSLAPMFEVMITIVLVEVDRAALGVGAPAVLEDLEQDVEDVGVGLLDLVEQQYRVGLAAHGL